MNYPKRQALVIGINEYFNLKPLKSAANDADAIATILEEQGNFHVKRMPSYKDENNRMRVHPTPSHKKAITLRRLTDEIKHFFNPQGEQIPEVALLFFAGHGLWYEEFGKYHNFLATVDSEPEKEFWGYDLDKLQKSLKFSPIKEKIVWLDACHSGALIRDFESQKETKWCLISAAPDHDVAGENQQQGVLTAALLKALDYQQNKSTFIDSHTLVKHLEAIRKADAIAQQFTYKNSEQPILLTGQHLAVKDESLQGVCPYKGLLYFDFQGHDPLFYKGRTALTAQLLDHVKKQRFVAVLGASGSGKSSLVRAGLIYQLQTGHNISGYWQILPIIRPGATPLAELTAVVAKVEQNYSEHLLIIDQFEEVFTLCQDEKQREAFFEQLLALTDLYLVIVMRADFFAHCIAKPYGGLADKIKNNLFTITPMTVEELKQAIEEPAEKVGFRVQALLTLEIIKDIEDSPSNLPLLQYTLEKVFLAQDANQQLTLSAYKQLGGIKGALASKADELYQGFSEAERETVKWLFLELTQLGEGQEDTRKQLTLPELEKNLGHRDGLAGVIAKLTTERLLIQDKNSSNVTIVDVAHEALIREWVRLRGWIDENLDFKRWKDDLSRDMKVWVEAGREKEALLHGVKLLQSEEQTNQWHNILNEEELAFITASVQERQRLSRIKQVVSISLVLLLIVSLVTGMFGWWQWGIAKQQSEIAELRYKGVSQERAKEHQKALNYYQQALKISRNINDNKAQVGNLSSDCGTMYMKLDKPKQALGYFKQALKIRKQLGNSKDVWFEQNNIVSAYGKLGQVEKALNFYQQATGVKGSGKPVGFIDNLNCSSDAFELYRSTKKLPLSIYMPLYHADQLKVIKDNCKIEMQSKGENILVSKANSPYTVIEKSSSSSVSSKINFAISRWLSNLWGEQSSKRESLAASR
jgi:tetratricopeptide (TPR) repeat protein